MNGYVYQFVALVLQAAQAHNITIDGVANYNVPPGNITTDGTGNPSPPSLTSYTITAIIGADDFNDDNTTLNEVFDVIVNITRQVTPTCASLNDLLFISSLTCRKLSWDCLGRWVCLGGIFRGCFLMVISTVTPHMDGPSALLNVSPRSLQRNSSTRFSSLETLCVHAAPPPPPRNESSCNSTAIVFRVTLSRRLHTRREQSTYLVTTRSFSSNSVSDTPPSPSYPLAQWAS